MTLKNHTLQFTITTGASNLSLRWTVGDSVSYLGYLLRIDKAPEILNGATSACSEKADVYALGMVSPIHN
jgi:hypothetical protein